MAAEHANGRATRHARTALEDTSRFDPDILAQLFGDNPNAISELLREFVTSATTLASRIRRGLRARDSDAVAAAAHQLKSSARSVGALSFGNVCEALELAGSNDQLSRTAELDRLFEAEFEAVMSYVESL